MWGFVRFSVIVSLSVERRKSKVRKLTFKVVSPPKSRKNEIAIKGKETKAHNDFIFFDLALVQLCAFAPSLRCFLYLNF
jgi:hypothetical protein